MERRLDRLASLFKQLVRRPLSFLTAASAVALIIIPLYQRLKGNVFLETLNWVDATTISMVGVLLLGGVISRRYDSDLQAVSIALIGALSFVYTFEALFKLSFFAFPWRMPPAELRDFVIQVGTALTGLAGFAFGKFRLSRVSWALVGILALGWIGWLLVGFPQVTTGKDFYTPVVYVQWTPDTIYALNRMMKTLMFLIFLSFYNFRQSAGYTE